MRFNDAILGILAILVGIVVFIHSQSFPPMTDGHPGPSLFPSVISTLFIIVGIVLCFHGHKSRLPMFTKLPELDAKGFGNIAMTLLSVVFFILFSERLGFLLTSFVCMIVLMLILKTRLFVALPVAGGMSLFIYTIFHKLLMVPLPRGFLYF